MVYVEADDLAPGIEVHIKTVRYLPSTSARPRLKLNIETVSFRVVMQ